MHDLADEVSRCAVDSGFSGVVCVERAGELLVDAAYGMADRANGIANTTETRFGIASVTKGFTALVVMRLVDDGMLALSTRACEQLASDLPLIDDRVTVEHLLRHRSGIGDYLDESAGHAIDDYVMSLPVHQYVTTDDYLVALDGRPTTFEPDTRFEYCNGGFVVLALLAERAGGSPFHELVERLVCAPAGMDRTAFLRNDALPGGVALGYLAADGLRTNVLHLPVCGSGDGGASSTVADIHRLWAAIDDGLIVAPETAVAMTTPRTDDADHREAYGLGFWLRPTVGARYLEGYDAGVSCRSVDHPSSGVRHTVISNTSDGAWPLGRLLDERLATA